MRGVRAWLRDLAAALTQLAGDPLLASVLGLGAAIIVAAGPWLVSVVALAIISVTMTPVMGFAAVEDLRLTVVYAVCIAPLAAGPIAAVAARRVSTAIEAGRATEVLPLFLCAATLASVGAQIIAAFACLALGIGPPGLALAFVFLTGTAALLWTSFAVLAAVRSFGILIAAFTGGMALSVASALIVALRAPTTEILVWCFAAGLALCVALSIRHVQRLHPCGPDDLIPTFRALLRHLRDSAILCAGVVLAICGVWIDKWVFWFGPDGLRSAAGFLHASTYDSVMFPAHLSVIPSYAALLIFHHGDLVTAIDRVTGALEARATHALLRERIEDLVRVAWSGILTIVTVQAAVTTGLVLMSPLLEQALDFSFDQFLMLRIGFIGVFFHAVMVLCCALLLVANRTRHVALIQAAFLVMNLTISLLSYAAIGISAYGFLASAGAGCALALLAAYRALPGYDYLLFLGENDSLYRK